MQEVVTSRVRGISIDWAHLENVWDWKLMEVQCKMPHIKYMHRAHALCVFRTGGCIAVKWKQYLTSPDWSRPVMLVPAHLAKNIADWRPPKVAKQFDPKFVALNVAWLHKFGMALLEARSDSHGKELEHLAAIVTGQVRPAEVSLDAVLADLRGCQRQPKAIRPTTMADDQLVQLFPGADHPEMPADALLEIPDRWSPKSPQVITPDCMIICQVDAKMCGLQLPFLLASVVGPTGPWDNLEILIVQWWVPAMAQISVRNGRSKDTVDIFGVWRSSGLLTLQEIGDIDLPAAHVDRSKVLMGPVDLVDSKLPFHVLDKLMDEHKIDVTGLTWTQTKNGNAFRQYRLMR